MLKLMFKLILLRFYLCSWYEVISIFLFALIGVYAFTGAIQGYLEQKLTWILRLATLGLAFFMLSPSNILIHSAAAIAFAFLLFFNVKKGQAQTLTPEPTAK